MFRNSTPGLKLTLSALTVVVTALFVFLLGILLAVPLFDLNYFTQSDLSAVQNSLSVQKYFQIISSLGIFVIPAFLAAVLLENRPLEFLSVNQSPRLYGVILATFSMYFLLPLIERLAVWNAGIELPEALAEIEAWMKSTEAAAMELTQEFMRMESTSDLILNLVMIALLPALGEELLFRGVIQQYLQKMWKNPHLAIWITAILFSLLHFQFYGFFPRMILGAFMGYLFWYSGSIWLAILAHLINNGTAVVYYFFNQDELQLSALEGELFSSHPAVVIISSLLFMVSFGLLIRIKR